MAKKKKRGEQREDPFEDIENGSVRHQKGLTPLLEEIARAIFAKVAHFVYPTFAQWELEFMRDLYPERQILIWENIARAYNLYVAEHPEPANNEQVVGSMVSISKGHAPGTDSEKELRKMFLEASKKQWLPLLEVPFKFPSKQALVLQYRNIIDEWDGGIFPNLRGKDDCRRILADAEIILGMATLSEEMFGIYGSERLAGGSLPKGLKTLVIRLDPENLKTHELEKICFVVEKIKGRYDCQ